VSLEKSQLIGMLMQSVEIFTVFRGHAKVPSAEKSSLKSGYFGRSDFSSKCLIFKPFLKYKKIRTPVIFKKSIQHFSVL
jgi:hypothetical protein